MDKSIVNIIKNFDSEGNLLVAGKRNTIKTFEHNQLVLNIKSFKIPILINGIIYRYFRKSKARRSFEHATILGQKNIGTPEPIGYYENKNFFRLLDSYYVCKHINVDYVFIDLFHKEWDENSLQILKEIAQFNFQLHEAGIEFKDNSPGNTLIKKNESGTYDFFLIDLNRMTFHKEMDFNLRMKNLCRLTPSEYMVQVISYEYAKLYNKPKEEVFQLMWKYTDAFFNKALKKRNFKKRLGL
ncbi:lipopolysaccharide kinase InaA family protein [Flavobacterium sp.]|uniref:lipopolysaccharide kinase InaA family protein n=1 Tax=Flavobacterium sp. TaxID=239 RepID=UPI001B48F2C9|nr:lipopolysaccharide kinase InaA family protein [Flavobacterium sp.]MBP6127217.1 Kdo domain containing protein [Flavobacterium sp.]